jgi:C1A family cysteine protease
MKASQRANRILNCEDSKKQELDWAQEHAAAAGVVRAKKIPDRVDLREKWWNIGNQFDTGACVGFATADSVVRWHMVKAGMIKKTEHLSERYVWMAAKETDDDKTRPTTFIDCEGTSLKAALDICRKYGVVLSTDLSFKGKLSKREVKTFYARAARRKIGSYFNLRVRPDKWREWIATQGPILARLVVDENFDDSRISTKVLNEYGKGDGGHAVAIVGYTKEHFIIRNSWGSWKDKGYAYATDAYVTKAFTEAYGIALAL